jgi:hypothetical protein
MSCGVHNPEPGVTGGAGIDVYVSHPFPHTPIQRDFIQRPHSVLVARGLAPRTTSDVETLQTSSLAAIKSQILESHGLLVVAFRKVWVERGTIRPDSEDPALPAMEISRSWLTSPYCQIEPAMAYQRSLPILVLREPGILLEGFLDRAADVFKAPEIDLLKDSADYFRSEAWGQTLDEWEKLVRCRLAAPTHIPSQ